MAISVLNELFGILGCDIFDGRDNDTLITIKILYLITQNNIVITYNHIVNVSLTICLRLNNIH